MNLPFIDLKSQYESLKEDIDLRIADVLRHGQYIMGPEVSELETCLEEFTGAKNCVTVSSGTDALLISLMALEVGPGDEVITTPFTFVSTSEVIRLLGAKPVFVDIERDTCNIDASLIQEKITSRTKAIIPVSLFGQPADMNQINKLAALSGNIPVIEDAAQSFGASYQGIKSGNLSTIGCTSFFPSKPLGCYGDGGAIFTSDDSLADICRQLRVHGQSERYVHTRIGVCGRMDTLQCAILLAKLKHFDWEVQQRLLIGERYNQLLDDRIISRVQQRSDRTSVFAQYSIFVDDREDCRTKLADKGLPTAVHYPLTLDKQPAYLDRDAVESFPVAYEVSAKVISLPMGPYLKERDQKKIVALL